MFTFGAITLIWTEQFTKKDLPLIPKAKKLGFESGTEYPVYFINLEEA